MPTRIDRRILPAVALTMGLLSVSPLLAGESGIPQLRKTGSATQLVVDGKPLVMLAGELHNSSASGVEYMGRMWPHLKALGLNTVLAPVSWELLEPVEGEFDFTCVDALVGTGPEARPAAGAVVVWLLEERRFQLCSGLGVERHGAFPRAKGASHQNSKDMLSTLSPRNLQADATAFARLMRHLQADRRPRAHGVDDPGGKRGGHQARDARHVGRSQPGLPVARAGGTDRLPGSAQGLSASRAVAALGQEPLWPPRELGRIVRRRPGGRRGLLGLALRPLHRPGCGGRAGGVCVADVCQRLVNLEARHVPQRRPGRPHARHLARRARHIALLAPDIYVGEFKEVCAAYARAGNPLWVPEASRDDEAAARAYWVIAQHRGLGFAPFGIEDLRVDHPLVDAYRILRQLLPLVNEAQASGRMIGIYRQGREESPAPIPLGDYQLRVGYEPRLPQRHPPVGGLAVQTGPQEFILAGYGFGCEFQGRTSATQHSHIGAWNGGVSMTPDSGSMSCGSMATKRAQQRRPHPAVDRQRIPGSRPAHDLAGEALPARLTARLLTGTRRGGRFLSTNCGLENAGAASALATRALPFAG